jgi:hypothetical protein
MTVPVSVVVVPVAHVGIIWQTPVQPHCPGLAGLPPQVCGRVQLPHGSVLPQPSEACPHVMFWLAHVIGVQLSGLPPVLPPQTLGMPPPPQVPASQVPHWTTPPHLVSVAAPQFAPSCAHVEGTQPELASPKPTRPLSLPPEEDVEDAPESPPEPLPEPDSTEESGVNVEVSFCPPPHPGKSAATASPAATTNNAARFMGLLAERGSGAPTMRVPPPAAQRGELDLGRHGVTSRMRVSASPTSRVLS